MRDLLCFTLVLLATGASLVSAQTARAVTPAERQEILDAHNEARSRTAQQQGVEDMPEMVWSDVVAQLGLDYLRNNNCPFSHNPNRRLPNGTTAGENLAAGHQSWRAAIYNGWYLSEEDDYLQNTGGVVGHYTQVTWTRSLEIGCAFCDQTGSGSSFSRLYICNYSPPGNFNRQPPWEAGSGTCRSCPSTHPGCTGAPFPGLCTSGAATVTTTTQTQTGPTQTGQTTTTQPTNTDDINACGTQSSGFHELGTESTHFLQSIDDAEECCNRCLNTAGCLSYTYGSGFCLLYNTASTVGQTADGFMVANIDTRATTQPQPTSTGESGSSRAVRITLAQAPRNNEEQDQMESDMEDELVSFLQVPADRIEDVTTVSSDFPVVMEITISGTDSDFGTDALVITERMLQRLILLAMSGGTSTSDVFDDLLEANCVDCGMADAPPIQAVNDGTNAGRGGLSTGLIAGLAIGGLVLIAGAVVGCYFWCRRRAQEKAMYSNKHIYATDPIASVEASVATHVANQQPPAQAAAAYF